MQIEETSSEHDLTPEEVKTNLKRLEIMGKVVRGEISPGEGILGTATERVE